MIKKLYEYTCDRCDKQTQETIKEYVRVTIQTKSFSKKTHKYLVCWSCMSTLSHSQVGTGPKGLLEKVFEQVEKNDGK